VVVVVVVVVAVAVAVAAAAAAAAAAPVCRYPVVAPSSPAPNRRLRKRRR
jgi:hypothetical protein